MKNTNPIFMQTVYVPLSLPAVNENVALRLNDFNYIQKIQVLGSYYINVF
jgi:Ca2+-dependent lipid-binding protein